jgi:ankyrin repeat protein
MNVDLTKNYPSWTTYFYISAPLFALCIVTVLFLKHDKSLRLKLKSGYNRLKATSTRIRNVQPLEDIEVQRIRKDTELFVWAVMNDCGKLVTQMIDGDGINLQERVYLGGTALHLAVECGHEDVVRRLVMKQRRTAAKENNVAILGHLLTLETIDVNEKDVDGSIALHVASWYGQLDNVKRLLEVGADILAKKNDGQTALHAAARNPNVDIVQALLDYDAEVNAQDDDGSTPLYIASWYGHEVVVGRLLMSGADVNAERKDGETAAHAALRCKHAAVLGQLQKVNAKPPM